MLRKRPVGENAGFKQRLLPLVRAEVKRQIENMMHLNDEVKDRLGESVFNDSDLQMAGYAAALKVLTSYTHIGGEDVTNFALRPRNKGEVTVVDEIVQQAAEAANSLLVPDGLSAETWQKINGIQRFYLRMMDIETTGASKLDNYQNFAKAFRVEDYGRVMGNMTASKAQLKRIDKLGIPCARWHTQKKAWLDPEGRIISPTGQEHIAKCPLRVGIVSTGLMMRDSLEKQHLLGLHFGVAILDEAHKARSRQGFGKDAGSHNELLTFMREIAARSDHVILGTATPIQTRPEDLWDLIGILHQGSGHFVLGNDYAKWHRPQEVLSILSGEQRVTKTSFAWELLRSPLPVVDSTNEQYARRLFSSIRQDLGLINQNDKWDIKNTLSDLSEDSLEYFEDELERYIAGASFFQRENPLIRHIVLRKRVTLEDAGLLPRIGVDVHPDRELAKEVHQFNTLFEGKALRTSEDFRQAYAEARHFGKALALNGKGSGFMKNLMEQRICSSIAAGLNTARMLLEGRTVREESDEQLIEIKAESLDEIAVLERMIVRLEHIKEDPKLNAVIHYLEKEKWLKFGVIIFSQYYDTAKWIADSLAERYLNQAVGLYAGAGRSRLYQKGESVNIERETLKRMVAEHQLEIMVATDAACEGLNLQTLGTLINIDLPWNPTRLEQRIGRIKRFGQVREKVSMLNLVNEQTVDEKVYEKLSERMQDRYNLFGSLPDTIRDEWIEDIETMGEKMDEYIDAQKQANGFDLRYTETMSPSDKDWRDCSNVLSRRDFTELMMSGWGESK
ncbi:helicase-related protein [Yersinia pseudotuberculosis]|uniref:helicase-related protein n=1 Tax=Yersinia pseudotuberculosis TaxID=633 RepID=UPI001D03A705|nr:helicase-related protein [Yersinia pseudotuberculosis]